MSQRWLPQTDNIGGAPPQPDEAWNPADSDDERTTSLHEAKLTAHHCPEHRGAT
ncbi:MAG: hypothetical protein OXU20_40395 [Myxococcales bacterium]|nr:hypothetical protein [Myxococcales bacterium]